MDIMGSSLEIGLYAQFLFYKDNIGVAGIAKKRYMPKRSISAGEIVVDLRKRE